MLSYKEYKLLNESLYNLGIRSPEVISEPIGKTGATETLEEAKKKCMKKGCSCGEEDENDEEDKEDVEDAEKDIKDTDVPDSVEDTEDDSSEDSEEKPEEKVMMMKKKMKKKSKKEWSELESDLNDLLEDIENTAALIEVKKGVEMIKKGMKKCKCESNMSDEYRSWWDSVNSMIGDVE